MRWFTAKLGGLTSADLSTEMFETTKRFANSHVCPMAPWLNKKAE